MIWDGAGNLFVSFRACDDEGGIWLVVKLCVNNDWPVVLVAAFLAFLQNVSVARNALSMLCFAGRLAWYYKEKIYNCSGARWTLLFFLSPQPGASKKRNQKWKGRFRRLLVTWNLEFRFTVLGLYEGTIKISWDYDGCVCFWTRCRTLVMKFPMRGRACLPPPKSKVLSHIMIWYGACCISSTFTTSVLLRRLCAVLNFSVPEAERLVMMRRRLVCRCWRSEWFSWDIHYSYVSWFCYIIGTKVKWD